MYAPFQELVSRLMLTPRRQNGLLTEELVVFVVCTTGQGQTPPNMVPFWNRLLHPALPHDLLEDLR